MKRVAVVTGANRGLGFETARQLARKGYEVIGTSRDPKKGEKAAAELSKEDLRIRFHSLDVKDPAGARGLLQFMETEYGRLDVLVNNAGVLLDSGVPTFETTPEMLREAMETNAFGPFFLCQRLLPLMKKNSYGRIVNVSSGMGQLSEMEGGYPSYRLSKTALNAVTRIFATEAQGSDILVNSACPGWVKTDMGGPGADRSPEEGADTLVWLATLPTGGPTGGFFRDRKPIDW